MAFVATAFPIIPGREERARSLESDMTGELKEHYETLNRRAGVRRHMEWVQESPMGSLLITVFETDTPEKMGRSFEDNAYDRWWRARLVQLHGIDPGDPRFADVRPPTMTYEWNDEVSTGHS